MELSFDPRQLLRIVWRRKWFFVAPAGFIGAVALGLALFLPPVYQAEATILIEEQDVPEDLVPSLFNDYVDRRLDMLTRRALLTSNLLRIAERYDLYPEQREAMSRSAIAALMRDNITTQVLSTEVNDPTSGLRSETTVAFKILFKHGDPTIARRVADDLVSFYLSTNLENRREVTTQTTNFFASERAAIEQRIAKVEEELARFQSENRELLPEEVAFSRQQLANVEQELRTLQSNLRSLREQESFLTTQLALTEEFEDDPMPAGASATPESELELLRAELATARARYSPGHPDVVRLQREVRSLETVVGGRAGVGTLVKQESRLVAERAALRDRYTADHPDVQGVERQLAGVRKAIEQSRAEGGTVGMTRSSAYVQLSAQLNSIQAEIGSVEQQMTQLREERLELQEQLAKAPMVEREYARLDRELENALADREVLAEKETSARLSGSLEIDAIGERLTLIEPPTEPVEPVSPNQRLILALGVIMALGVGGSSVTAAQLLDRSVRSSVDLSRLLGDAPLVAIPQLVAPAQRRRLLAMRLGVGVVVLGLLGGALYWVDRTVAPLDVLGHQLQNRAEVWFARTFPDVDGW